MPQLPTLDQWLNKFANNLVVEAAKAEQESLRKAKQLAVRLSSGGYTSRTLAALGHPYAEMGPRRNPPPADPAIINHEPGGAFKTSWRTQGPYSEGGDLVSELKNIDPKAGFLRGTVRMIPRPICEKIVNDTYAARRARLENALQRAIAK